NWRRTIREPFDSSPESGSLDLGGGDVAWSRAGDFGYRDGLDTLSRHQPGSADISALLDLENCICETHCWIALDASDYDTHSPDSVRAARRQFSFSHEI